MRTRYTGKGLGPGLSHHFVTTSIQGRIPPTLGPAVPWHRPQKEDQPRCRSPANFIRTLALLAIAAIVAAVAAASVGAAPAKKSATTISGAGSSFVAPLVNQWIPAVGSAYGYELQYNPIGSGGGRCGHYCPHGRLRRERRAALGRPVHRLQGLRPDPLGPLGHLGDLQPRRREEPAQDGRPHARADLRGQDHELERPCDREAQQGVSLPSTKIAIVRRSDNSGTTFNFTDYLSSVSGRGSPGPARVSPSTGRRGRARAAAPASRPRSVRRPVRSATLTSRTRRRTTSSSSR